MSKKLNSLCETSIFWDTPKYGRTRIGRSRVKEIHVFREQKSPTRYNGTIAGSNCHRGGSVKSLF